MSLSVFKRKFSDNESQSKNKKLKINIEKVSFDRICDDLCAVILSYLPFNDKVRLMCVSKQFQRCIWFRENELHITGHRNTTNITREMMINNSRLFNTINTNCCHVLRLTFSYNFAKYFVFRIASLLPHLKEIIVFNYSNFMLNWFVNNYTNFPHTVKKYRFRHLFKIDNIILFEKFVRLYSTKVIHLNLKFKYEPNDDYKFIDMCFGELIKCKNLTFIVFNQPILHYHFKMMCKHMEKLKQVHIGQMLPLDLQRTLTVIGDLPELSLLSAYSGPGEVISTRSSYSSLNNVLHNFIKNGIGCEFPTLTTEDGLLYVPNSYFIMVALQQSRPEYLSLPLFNDIKHMFFDPKHHSLSAIGFMDFITKNTSIKRLCVPEKKFTQDLIDVFITKADQNKNEEYYLITTGGPLCTYKLKTKHNNLYVNLKKYIIINNSLIIQEYNYNKK
jgi:hypothetical protein